jgi:superoxide reductase
MAEKREIYKCRICGNIVEVLHSGKANSFPDSPKPQTPQGFEDSGQGILVCCGENMEKLQEKTGAEEGKEKHVPVITKTPEGWNIKVGSIEHPMLPEHYIEWIEIIEDEFCARRALNSGEKPEANFESKSRVIRARAYCNVHGLWSS